MQEYCHYANFVSEEQYLIDSGATCHVTSSSEFLEAIIPENIKVVVGDNSSCQAQYSGTLDLGLSNHGGDFHIVVNKVYYVPTFNKKVLSAGRMIEQGYNFTLKEKVCGIHFPDGRTLTIKASKDKLFYITVKRHHQRYYDLSSELPETNSNECVISYDQRPKNIIDYHDKFRHLGEFLLRMTLRHH